MSDSNDHPTNESRANKATETRRLVFRTLWILCVGLIGAGALMVFGSRSATRGDPAAQVRPLRIVFPHQPSDVLSDELPKITFRDITDTSGIDFVHDNGATGEWLLPEAYGSGCAFVDFNNDDAIDIVFVNGMPAAETGEANTRITLFANDGHGQFEDVPVAGDDSPWRYGMGIAAGDYDNDGWIDLYITAVGRNALLKNHEGEFVDVTADKGVGGSEDEWSTGACWFDADQDGDLDLFVGNYVAWSEQVDRVMDCRLRGDTRSYCHPNSFPGTYPRLYRNDGERFTDISAEAGVRIGNPDTGVPAAKSLAVAPFDYDEDGWNDLLVVNDGVGNFLLRNNHDGTFEDIGHRSGTAFDGRGQARRATGLDLGRLGNDGATAMAIGGIALQPLRMYRRHADSTIFLEDSTAIGLGPLTLSSYNFGVLFLDADLDGRPDVLTTNGHVEREIHRLQNTQTFPQAAQLYWNAGRLSPETFTSLPDVNVGGLATAIVGRGSAFADIDADGDLDVLMTANGGAPRLFRNDVLGDHSGSKPHWLRVRLVGTNGNRDALGAIVELSAGEIVQRRDVRRAPSFLSQSETILTFGLGKQSSVQHLAVDWHDGTRTELKDLSVDRVLKIVQE